MRRSLYALAGLAAALSFAMLSRAPEASASTAAVSLTPSSVVTAWNADRFAANVSLDAYTSTTLCQTNPSDPQSPTAACGVGAFDVKISWDPAAVGFVSWSPGPLLASTGREVTCTDAVVTASLLRIACATLRATPLGPTTGGILATLQFTPLVQSFGTVSPVSITRARVTDIAGDNAAVAATGTSVQFAVCADATGDGEVDMSDVTAILALYGQSAPPADQRYDPTRDGAIDLDDALLALGEFGQSCVYP